MADGVAQGRLRVGLEPALTDIFPFVVDALGVSALGLLVPASLSLRWRFMVQLLLLSLFALFLAYRLLPRIGTIWFADSALTKTQRVFATGLAAVVAVTGTVGLVTLASSAALRLQPSAQFLQLLSALDIAWAAVTVIVAVFWLTRRVALAMVSGAVVVFVCMLTVARYVDDVAFGPGGGWRLRAQDLWEYVLPFDIAVAVVAIGLFVFAVRRRAANVA